MAKHNTYYGDYLQLDKLLDAQKTKSSEVGQEAHDETLFIIVHQVYELWFKQIIHEIKSMQEIFSGETTKESDLAIVDQRFERIKKILAILCDQLEVMETMSPMDFLEFRDLLVPASGFQSVQFREVEIRLGLSTKNRKQVDKEYFLGRLSQKDREKIDFLETETTLFTQLESWLERMPFSKIEGKFNFWDEYQKSVKTMLDGDKKTIETNLAGFNDKVKGAQLDFLKVTENSFKTLTDEKMFNEQKEKGVFKFSQKAVLNALFICLYRNEPILNLPYKIITHLIDMDELFTTWRSRHAMMAQRMLGMKIGTGGSSGHDYLKSTAEHNRVFKDLFNLSTFIIPQSILPKIPETIRERMNFSTEG